MQRKALVINNAAIFKYLIIFTTAFPNEALKNLMVSEACLL